jgi:hypothetical protein
MASVVLCHELIGVRSSRGALQELAGARRLRDARQELARCSRGALCSRRPPGALPELTWHRHQEGAGGARGEDGRARGAARISRGIVVRSSPEEDGGGSRRGVPPPEARRRWRPASRTLRRRSASRRSPGPVSRSPGWRQVRV